MNEHSIGEISRRTGVKVTTVRFYEQRGLIAPPARTTGGQRRYDEAAMERLTFLRHARELGFGLEDIADLMTIAETPTEDCAPAHEIARKQLAAVDRRMTILGKLRQELAARLHLSHEATYRALRTLVDAGRVINPSRGVYRIPSGG